MEAFRYLPPASGRTMTFCYWVWFTLQALSLVVGPFSGALHSFHTNLLRLLPLLPSFLFQ